jgi:Polyketide cyclase / dehydrase and lipid transport
VARIRQAKARSATATGVAHADLATTWRIAQPITPVGFYPKFGPLPAVVGVRNQTGDWDAAGQSRTLVLSDGGTVVETTAIVDAPGFFAYDLTDFTKLFGHLVAGARAEWSFATDADGTRITWTYAFHPLPRVGGIVGAIVKLFWAPYMRSVLPAIIAEVEKRA